RRSSRTARVLGRVRRSVGGGSVATPADRSPAASPSPRGSPSVPAGSRTPAGWPRGRPYRGSRLRRQRRQPRIDDALRGLTEPLDLAPVALQRLAELLALVADGHKVILQSLGDGLRFHSGFPVEMDSARRSVST